MPQKMTAKDIWPLIKASFKEWNEDKVPKMAAALAYYTAVSLAPLLVITIKVVGIVSHKTASQQVQNQLASLTDPRIADALKDAIDKAGQPGAGTMATIISIIVALFGASGVFGEMQDSLNTIWEVRPKSNRGIWGTISDRFLSMSMVLGSAFLLLVSMFVSTLITGTSSAVISHTIGADGTIAKVIGFLIDLVLSTGVVTCLFAGIYKILPDVKITWKDVWLGAFTTALLFQIGKYLLSIYLAKASPGSAYGAAGSLVAVLLWVCYSSYILYFGAEFTQVYACKFGTRIVPSKNAEPLTEERRREAGIPHDKSPSPSPGAKASSASKKPAAGAPHRPLVPRRRIVHRPSPAVAAALHPSYVARFLPLFAGVVVGRFAWKRYHDTGHIHPAPQTIKSHWETAAQKWKKLARLFVSDAAHRYALTHGPAGRSGSSWSDVAEKVGAE